MSKLSQSAEQAVRLLVEDIVRGNYAGIESNGRVSRLTQDELKRAVTEYGRTLTQLPENALDAANIFPLENVPGQTAAELPLWTKEEGPSDLILSLTLLEETDRVTVSINNLHVLQRARRAS
jgi:hypothetical protein